MFDELDEVPEITAANRDGGAERLDADPINDATISEIDSMLDEAEAETASQDNTTETEVADQDIAPENQTDQQAEAAPVAAPVVPEVEEPKVEIDPDILAIEQPRNLSEKNQNNWRKLQETATLYKKQAAEAEVLRQKLAEAENRPAETPADYEELKKFRAIFDIKNDPSFKSKFEEPINSASENIYSLMKKHGASDEVIKSIKDIGGPDKVDPEWWKQNAFDRLSFTDAERLKRHLVDVVDLKEKQEAEIANAAENADKWYEEKKVAESQKVERETQELNKYINTLTETLPWARYQEVPENATPEQIAKIKAHNANVQDLSAKFYSAYNAQTATERAAVSAAATLSHVLTKQLQAEQQRMKDLESQIAKLTSENSQLKSAGKLPKTSINTPASVKVNTLNDRIKMSSADAIDLGLSEAGE